MPTAYTSLLGLALPVTGELPGTWGDTVNDYITRYVDAAVAGAQTISGSQTAVTLSTTNGTTLNQAGSGATGSAQYAIINCTGNPGGLLTVTAPATSKVYLVINATSTNQSVKVVGTGPTTGVTVAASRAALIAWNGSDFRLIATTDVSQLSGILAVANGGTGQTSYTDGQLLIGNTATGGLTKAALTAGSGISITNGNGSISIAAAGGSSTLTISNKTGAYTVVSGDNGTIINCTSGTFTVSLTAAATLGSGFNCWIWNTGTGTITIDPNASETIDGVSTLILRQGEGTQIVCDGTNWNTGDKKTMRGYAENIANNATRPVASASSSIAIGTNSAGNGSQAVTGAGAMALGGSYASGTDSFAAAVADNTSAYGANGTNSVAIGYRNNVSFGTYAACIGGGSNTASDNRAVVFGGQSNTASSSYAGVFGGQNNTASNQYAAVVCGANNIASQLYSLAIGSYANADRWGKFAQSAGNFGASAKGDAQHGTMVLRRSTTDATVTVLTADGNVASTTNQVILPNDSTYAFRILVVARRTDADNESAGYEFVGVVDRNANAASTALVGTVTKTVIAEDTAAWDVNVTADTTNGGIKVEVTGEVGKTIRWVATCWTSEVTG